MQGAVAPANIVVGAELAASTSVRVIANPNFSIPSGCSGTNEECANPLGAQAAYWVWVPSRSTAIWPATRARAAQLQRFIIFAPPVVAATQHLSRAAPLVPDANANQQVTNPVFTFPTDNNGTILTDATGGQRRSTYRVWNSDFWHWHRIEQHSSQHGDAVHAGFIR